MKHCLRTSPRCSITHAKRFMSSMNSFTQNFSCKDISRINKRKVSGGFFSKSKRFSESQTMNKNRIPGPADYFADTKKSHGDRKSVV